MVDFPAPDAPVRIMSGMIISSIAASKKHPQGGLATVDAVDSVGDVLSRVPLRRVGNFEAGLFEEVLGRHRADGDWILEVG